AITLATVYYAVRTGDMVDAMDVALVADRQRLLDGAVGNLIGSALAAAATAGGLAGLLKWHWRWALPGAAAARDRFALAMVSRLTAELSSALRWSEEVVHLAPELKAAADAVVAAAVEAHGDAIAGHVEHIADHGRRLRERTDALRELA